jgi:hypothetical protein
MSTPAAGRPDEHAKQREIDLEQAHVDLAYRRLDTMRAEAQTMLTQGYRQSQVGTRASLVERDVMVFRAEQWARTLDAADNELVFGRLDMAADRDGDREVRHIGRLGIRSDDSEILVVDWRAPAAESFYRASPQDPRDVIRRRVLHCKGHDVIDVEDDLLMPDLVTDDLTIVGDGAFLAALSRTREGTMRDIVATIQQEQDEAIRAGIDGSVLVRGGPGTGKTAVALHRVAYLMFNHRKRFGSRGVLVVGPNPRFTAYIERVLPALGEGSATLRSLGDMGGGVTAAYHDTADVARIKGDAAMIPLLRRAVFETPAGAPAELRIRHRGTEAHLDTQKLRGMRRELLSGRNRGPNTVRVAAARALLDTLWRQLRNKGAAQSEREAFYDDVAAREEFQAFLATWWPLQKPADVLAGLADQHRLRRIAKRMTGHQVRLLADSWQRTARAGEVSFHDIALIDELSELLGPLPKKRPFVPGQIPDDNPYVVDGLDIFTGERMRNEPDEIQELSTYADRMARKRVVDPDDEPDEYAHIVVDEAQDLTPMQWRMLQRRGTHATWTIVEDPAQSAWEDLDASREAMGRALGPRKRYEFELTTNYRNPVEVADVAARVLVRAVPGAKPSRAVRTGGQPPKLYEGGPEAVRAVVENLLATVEGTVGVVTPVGATGPVAEALAGLPQRVQPMDALDAKGLEFDAAVIVDPKGIVDQSPRGMRTLYVALTRATQHLAVVTTDPEWTRELTGIV